MTSRGHGVKGSRPPDKALKMRVEEKERTEGPHMEMKRAK